MPGLVVQAIEHLIPLGVDEILRSRRGARSDDVDLARELVAEFIEREVVGVEAERVLDLAPDGGDAQHDVGADHRARDGDPAKRVPELEGERDDVDPGDLRDGDGVGFGQGGGEHAFGAGEDVGEVVEEGEHSAGEGAVVEGAVFHDALGVSREVG